MKKQIEKMKSITIKKGEKVLLHFPDLDNIDDLKKIKEIASSVFGAKNVLVIMGDVRVSKVKQCKDA
jgi:hypothetical protein